MTQKEQDHLDFPSIPALLMDYYEAYCPHMSSRIYTILCLLKKLVSDFKPIGKIFNNKETK